MTTSGHLNTTETIRLSNFFKTGLLIRNFDRSSDAIQLPFEYRLGFQISTVLIFSGGAVQKVGPILKTYNTLGQAYKLTQKFD
jgi:hypothetical protein